MATKKSRNWWPNETVHDKPDVTYNGPADPVGGEQQGVQQDLPGLLSNVGFNNQYDVEAGRMDPSTRTVQDQERAQWQLDQMLQENGPLMQRARAQGYATAGQRGLMNSSLAGGAAMGAMVDRAQPFVLNDANTYAKTASENMGAKNSASQTNAQLMTNANIAAANLGGQMDLAKYNAETTGVREEANRRWQTGENQDQRGWQSGENQDQRDWTTGENQDQRDWQSGENELNRDWTSEENMHQRMLQWATAELTAYTNMYGSKTSAMAQVMANIYSNPELTADEQRAAWANAQVAFKNLYGEDFQPPPGFPTYGEEQGTQPTAPPPDNQQPPPEVDPYYTDPSGAAGNAGYSNKGNKHYLHTQEALMPGAYTPPLYSGGTSYNSQFSPAVATVMDGLPDLY